jgi:broad specificity phosphatase PhoE
MTVVHFITHPEVTIDPDIPVIAWQLSPTGRRRMTAALQRPWIAMIGSVFCSSERKAADAAGILANHLGLIPVVFEALAENDRSATGYLPKPEFEAVANQFFARPEQSIRGWERAIDAQRRIVRAVERVVAVPKGDGDIAIVSHGGVGTLLLCHLKGTPISRAEDQPGAGGGNFFSFDTSKHRLLSGWRSIDD